MSKMTTNRQQFVTNQNSNNKRKYSSNNHSSLSSSTSLTSLAQPLNVNNLNFRLINFSSQNNNDNTMNSNTGSRFTRLVRSKSGYTYTSLSENDNEDDENISPQNNNINNSSDLTKTPKSKHLSNSQNKNQTTPTRQRADSSSGMLDSSEWILFSPGHSRSNETGSFYDDDVLSSTLDRSESHATGSGDDINEESYVNIDDDGELSDDEEEDEDEDDDDSLIDDLQDHIDKNIPFKKEDLNTRIDNWRRQQVNILLNDLSNDNAGLDIETIELIKSWGIEDDVEASKDLTTNSLSIGNFSLIDKFYGDKLLNNYSNDDLKSLKKILTDLSTALDRQKTVKKITKARKRELHHLRHLHQHQHHLHLHHRHLHHLHHLHHHDAHHYLPSSSTSSLSSSQSSKRDPNQFMNNKKLQKYIPIFLKNLIINSELLPEFEKLQKDELRFDEDEDDDKTDTEGSSASSVTTAVVRKSLIKIEDRKDSIISNFDRDLRSSSLVVVGNDEDDSKKNKKKG